MDVKLHMRSPHDYPLRYKNLHNHSFQKWHADWTPGGEDFRMCSYREYSKFGFKTGAERVEEDKTQLAKENARRAAMALPLVDKRTVDYMSTAALAKLKHAELTAINDASSQSVKK